MPCWNISPLSVGVPKLQPKEALPPTDDGCGQACDGSQKPNCMSEGEIPWTNSTARSEHDGSGCKPIMANPQPNAKPDSKTDEVSCPLSIPPFRRIGVPVRFGVVKRGPLSDEWPEEIARMNIKDMKNLGVYSNDAVVVRSAAGRALELVLTIDDDDSVSDKMIGLDWSVCRTLGLGVRSDDDDSGPHVDLWACDSIPRGEKIVMKMFVGCQINADVNMEDFVLQHMKDSSRILNKGQRLVWGGVHFTVAATEPASSVRVGGGTQLGVDVKKEQMPSDEFLWNITPPDIGGYEAIVTEVTNILAESLPCVVGELGQRYDFSSSDHNSKGRGMLITGCSGVGKTHMVYGIANRLGLHIWPVDYALGDAPQVLRDAILNASESMPALILIDRAEDLLSTKSMPGNKAVGLLASMMDYLPPGVFLVALSSRPEFIDRELVRHGRFAWEINMSLPSLSERRDIMGRICARLFGNEVEQTTLCRVADTTLGCVAADLVRLAILASETHPKDIGQGLLENLCHVSPSLAKGVVTEFVRVRWEDVAGMEETKQNMRAFIEYPIRHAHLYKEYGIKAATGALLHGPPGCGKTFLVKALATETGTNFVSVKGPELLSSYFGESEANIRKVFEKASSVAPSILFFDEIDSVGGARGKNSSAGGANDRVVNQLLTEIDGTTSLHQVFFIGATNMPELIDEALMRRMQRLVYVPLPDKANRVSIIRGCLNMGKANNTTPLSPDITDEYLSSLANETDGCSCADIATLVSSAVQAALAETISHTADITAADGEESSKVKVGRKHLQLQLPARRSVSQAELSKFEKYEFEMRRKMCDRVDATVDDHDFHSFHQGDAKCVETCVIV